MIAQSAHHGCTSAVRLQPRWIHSQEIEQQPALLAVGVWPVMHHTAAAKGGTTDVGGFEAPLALCRVPPATQQEQRQGQGQEGGKRDGEERGWAENEDGQLEDVFTTLSHEEL